MSQSRSRVTRVFATAAVLTAAACAPERSPTVPVLPEDASFAAGGNGNGGGGGGGAKVKIKTLQVASTTLTVDGPSVVATISIGNTGVALESGVSVVAQVAQTAAFHEAANVQTMCAPSAQPGFLPKGTCTMTFDVRASSSTAGSGNFESGPAVLSVRLLQTANGSTTELAIRTIDVSLVVVPPPTTPFISSVTLGSTTLTINGPSTTYTATIENPGPPLQNLTLQGYMVQGANRYTAGGTAVTCGGLPQLPTGTCDVSFITYASTDLGGPGPLVPGPAAFELQLLQTAGGTTVLDAETVDVNLVDASPPVITSITPAFNQLMINGRTEAASIAIDNQGPQRSTVLIKGWIVQGFAREVAINGNVECGGTSGTLPSGTCATLASISVRSTLGPPFGLAPGAATLEIQLTQTEDTTETTLDTESIPVTLVAATPWIATSGVPSTIPIGSNIGFAVIVTNTTDNVYANNTLAVNVIQGGVATAVTSVTLSCGGGVLPKGDCIQSVTINLGSSFSPGAAKVELRLYTNSGVTLLDVKQYDVTLATP